MVSSERPTAQGSARNQAQRAQRRGFSTIFAKSSVGQGPEANFGSFLRCGRDGRYAFRISFNGVSYTSSMFRIACSRARRNFEKLGHGTSKTFPGVSKNPRKSSPERPKTQKIRLQATRNAARCAKSSQKAPNSEK